MQDSRSVSVPNRTAARLALVLLALPLSSLAQYANVEGVLSSKTVTLRLVALDPEKGVMAASTTVAVGLCTGSIAGIGTIRGEQLSFTPYLKVDSHDQCVVTVSFTDKRKSARITATGCMAYSGVACGWAESLVVRTPQQTPP
jgi:hypothetical protein